MSPVISIGRVVGDCVSNQIADSPEQVSDWSLFAGGAAANIASTLVRLGESAVLVACVGSDKVGTQLLGSLEWAGVNVSFMKVVEGGQTLQVKILRNSTGSSTVLKPDLQPSHYADVALCREMIDAIPDSYFAPPGALALQSTQLAFESGREALHRAVDRACEKKLPVVFDVNWRASYWDPLSNPQAEIRALAERVQYLKLTQAEADWLCGAGATPDDIAGQFPQLRGVLVTNGKHGAEYIIHGTAGHAAAFTITAVDSTGAGDAFVAGFLYKLCHNGEAALADPGMALQAVQFANACGALAASKLGATNVIESLAEVERLLQSGKQELAPPGN